MQEWLADGDVDLRASHKSLPPVNTLVWLGWLHCWWMSKHLEALANTLTL